MKRITITIDESIYDQLPRKNKSSYITGIMKQHFQFGARDMLYQYIQARLEKEQLHALKARVTQLEDKLAELGAYS